MPRVTEIDGEARWIVDEKIGFLSRSDTALLSCVIANIWFGITFFAIMLFAALQAIPQSLYEAADMDGASARQVFLRVTVPMVKSTIVGSGAPGQDTTRSMRATVMPCVSSYL